MADRLAYRKRLGEPYYDSPQFVLYRMDCLEGLRRLDGSLIDLTVTSPPYNIGKEYERPRPLQEYVEWCASWIAEVHRISAATGSFWLNLGYLSVPEKAKALPIPYLLWDRVPFFLVQEVVWNYGAGVAGRRFFSPRNEKFLWYVKDADEYTFNLDQVRDPNIKYPNQKKNGRIKVNPIGKNPGDVWAIPKVTSGRDRASKERTPHPAQFPIAVIERIIRASSDPGDWILDPFMGSGTTAAAALALGRKVIGFEISEEYCELAVKRVHSHIRRAEEERRQRSLFVSVAGGSE